MNYISADRGSQFAESTATDRFASSDALAKAITISSAHAVLSPTLNVHQLAARFAIQWRAYLEYVQIARDIPDDLKEALRWSGLTMRKKVLLEISRHDLDPVRAVRALTDNAESSADEQIEVIRMLATGKSCVKPLGVIERIRRRLFV